MNRRTTIPLVLAAIALGCQSPLGPSSRDGARIPASGLQTAEGGVQSSATGGGHYVISLATGPIEAQFSMSAVARADGRTSGQFHHRTVLNGLAVDFHGEVTCLAVDSENRRAWVGGSVTQNRSENPSFLQPRHEPGRDIWFRVLDNGQGHADPDRTTFVGFEGDAGITTSAEYCTTRPWPDANARTWPISGNVSVRP
jgi:hypothetical protein